MRFCYVCKNNDPNYSYHKFPNDLKERKKWTKACGLHVDDIFRNTRVCSKHFLPECFTTGPLGGVRLIRGSMPTLHLRVAWKRKKRTKVDTPVKVGHCCARGCTNECIRGGSLMFHRFPLHKPEMLKRWVDAACGENFTPTVNTLICSEHFTKDCYTETSFLTVRLRKDAVPTIFDFKEPFILCEGTELQKDALLTHFGSERLQETSCSLSEPVTRIKSEKENEPELIPVEYVDVPLTSEIGTQTSVTSLQKENGTQTSLISPTNESLKQKIRELQKKVNLKTACITNLTVQLQQSKQTNFNATALEDKLSGFALELFKNQVENQKVPKIARKYSEEVEQFAVNLYSYSPKAYLFVSKQLCLPSCSKIKQLLSKTYYVVEDNDEERIEIVIDDDKNVANNDQTAIIMISGNEIKLINQNSKS